MRLIQVAYTTILLLGYYYVVSSSAFLAPSAMHTCQGINGGGALLFLTTPKASSASSLSQTILCDLQTFLRLVDLVPTGGSAKTVIQAGECQLNGTVESRRAKKLFHGDIVSFGGVTFDVSHEVSKRGYVYKIKPKKMKPEAKVDADGNKEFGGKYRSEEWRKERKQKKEQRRKGNQEGEE